MVTGVSTGFFPFGVVASAWWSLCLLWRMGFTWVGEASEEGANVSCIVVRVKGGGRRLVITI